ncbi:hypothetical protein AQUCO_00700629v1 [Aquilegia coerulea]|uniref:BRI1 kinase inhibitor 1 n=1 Tax=Aquilegia coerulea TaxID=218851 RepID=A0A2G5EKZ7_AQUCA|nr:hypothetical protein AQUCO_00700629v1 [Aquilegia coerulea]
MSNQPQQQKKEKEGGVEAEKTREGKENQLTKQPSSAITSSPPSASSSPSHEFSFTISLHPSSVVPNKTKSSPPSFAIDLSPADDIFFHGHLLPLHLLSHLPISPRASTTSFESFSLPLEDQKLNSNLSINKSNNNTNTKGRNKAKTFSLFGFSKRRKGGEVGERERDENEEIKRKRKLRFNVRHIFRRYVRIIRPLLIFKGVKRENGQLRRQPYSFSGNLSWKGKHELRGRRGEFSAPASMYTSPTNSGPLVPNTSISSSKSDSTMEELQSAIQAAIAHCKNSISIKEEKINC